MEETIAVDAELDDTGARRGGARPGRLPPARAAAVVYTIAMFMSIMDTQIVNVALPTLSRDFHATLASTQWVITAYLMAIAVSVPASGWLGDRFGTKRVFLAAIAAFTVASALCAASANLPELVVTRILQGAGGGMMVPTGMAMLYRAYPQNRRVHVARVVTGVMVLAPATAPIIGGSLVTWASWRWIFVVNIPFGTLALLTGLSYLAEHREPPRGRFDAWGALLGGVGLGLLLYAVGEGPTEGWGSTGVLGPLCGALATLAGFVVLELHREHPLLDLGLLRDRTLRRCVATITPQSIAFFGSLVFVTLYLQEARGVSPINSGLSTFPEAVAIGLTSQVVSRLYPRVGPRRLMTAGFLGFAVVTAALADAGLGTSLWTIRALTFALGICASFIMLPNQAAAFAQVSSADTGHATAIFSVLQRASSSIAVAVLATVLALAGGNVTHGRPPVSAFHWAFGAGVIASLVGAGLALRVRDADAAPTMAARREAPVIMAASESGG